MGEIMAGGNYVLWPSIHMRTVSIVSLINRVIYVPVSNNNILEIIGNDGTKILSQLCFCSAFVFQQKKKIAQIYNEKTCFVHPFNMMMEPLAWIVQVVIPIVNKYSIRLISFLGLYGICNFRN